jgi:hypothetical protein
MDENILNLENLRETMKKRKKIYFPTIGNTLILMKGKKKFEHIFIVNKRTMNYTALCPYLSKKNMCSW